jgi:hypothetical protein
MAFVWISIAFKNGAGFYMDYFSKKYEDQLKTLEQKWHVRFLYIPFSLLIWLYNYQK